MKETPSKPQGGSAGASDARVGVAALTAAGVLLLLIAAALPDVIRGRSSFFEFDLYFQHHPFWVFAERTLRAGEFPFWTPGIRAGYPLHANGEAGLLHPLTLPLNLWLPAHRAIDVFVLIHLWLTGCFSWLLLRELGVRPLLSLTGAASLMLSARTIGSAFWPNAAAVTACLPLALYGVARSARDPRSGSLALAAAVGLGLLAGRPQHQLLGLLLIVPFGLFNALCPVGERPEGAVRTTRTARFLALLVGLALGGMIGAPQALPTLFFLQSSGRAAGIPYETWLPTFLGEQVPFALLRTFLPAVRGDWPEASSYSGVVALVGLLCALGAVARDLGRRRTIGVAGFLLVMGFVFFALAGGSPWAHSFTQAFPGLRSLRIPTRFLFPAVFAGLIAASLGLERMTRHLSSPAWRRRVPIALCAFAICDLVFSTWRAAPLAPSSVYSIARDARGGPRAATDATGAPYRIYADHIPVEVTGYGEAELLARLRELPPLMDLSLVAGLRSASGYGEPQFFWAKRLMHAPGPRFLRMLGVRRLWSARDLGPVLEEQRGRAQFAASTMRPAGRQGPAWVYDLEALPRAIVVLRAVAVRSFAEAVQRIRASDFDPASQAVVEGDLAPLEGAGGSGGSVELTSEGANRLSLSVTSEGPGLLVLFDTWAPGWTARVDGQRTTLHRANAMFRGVAVPSGRSRVDFSYEPPGLRVGLALGIPAAGVWLFLLLRAVSSRRSAGRGMAMGHST